jgi:hydrogenase maturation protease HycI
MLNRVAAARSSNRPTDPTPRLSLLGVGNEFNGDDAVGVLLARAIALRLSAPPAGAISPFAFRPATLLVIDAGLAPENFTGQLRRYAPDLVILADAAHMGASPGAVRWLDWRATDGLSTSTHTLPPYLLAEYLTAELGCEVALLGIQPADNTPGAPLSSAVSAALQTLVHELSSLLANARLAA